MGVGVPKQIPYQNRLCPIIVVKRKKIPKFLNAKSHKDPT